jgi:hypothetical protein
VSPGYIQIVPDRVRYSYMGGIVLLTAIAATASLTVALSLLFPRHSWLGFLRAGGPAGGRLGGGRLGGGGLSRVGGSAGPDASCAGGTGQLPRRRRRARRTIAAVPITATVAPAAPAAVMVASLRASRLPATA